MVPGESGSHLTFTRRRASPRRPALGRNVFFPTPRVRDDISSLRLSGSRCFIRARSFSLRECPVILFFFFIHYSTGFYTGGFFFSTVLWRRKYLIRFFFFRARAKKVRVSERANLPLRPRDGGCRVRERDGDGEERAGNG